MTALALLMVLGGVLFLVVSSVGILRLPDFYTRAHAVGATETLGAMLVLGGFALYQGAALTSLKLLLILAFLAVANPTATHVLARAALRSGVEIWSRRKGEGG